MFQTQICEHITYNGRLRQAMAAFAHISLLSLLQDIRQQEAVILQAMLRPEKLLHFLRPGRLVRHVFHTSKHLFLVE